MISEVSVIDGGEMEGGFRKRRITLIPSEVGKAIVGYPDDPIAVMIPQLLLQMPCDIRVFVRYITLAPMAMVTMLGRLVA